MTKTMNLHMSLSGENTIEILRAFMKLKPFNQKPPTLISLDMYAEQEGVSDWIERWVPTCTHGVIAYWGNPYEEGEKEEGSLSFDRYYRDNTQVAQVLINDYPRSIEAVLEMLSPLPWQLAEFRPIHLDWLNPDIDYIATGFFNSHFEHGWGCAFKGAGHNHLVSRRWLEFGPWRLIRDEANDISLVQFHDLEVDALTALEQAKPGHERMGVSDTGGFINSKFEYQCDLKGLYESAERRLKIVNVDRPVPQREMLELCAARFQQNLGAEKPIDRLGYVFLFGEQGYDYLHELWLREIECWAIIKGVEMRLDTDYHPTPEIPDWVKRLEAAEFARSLTAEKLEAFLIQSLPQFQKSAWCENIMSQYGYYRTSAHRESDARRLCNKTIKGRAEAIENVYDRFFPNAVIGYEPSQLRQWLPKDYRTHSNYGTKALERLTLRNLEFEYAHDYQDILYLAESAAKEVENFLKQTLAIE